MNCREFEALVTGLARGIESPGAARHTAGCPACAARLTTERRLSAALRALADTGEREAPRRVERELLAAFRARRRRAAWIPWPAAAAAALLLAALWLASPGPGDRPDTAPELLAAAPRPAHPLAPSALPQRRPRVPEPEPEFIPLPGAPDLPGDFYVARIRAPRAALVAAGLPVNMDRAEQAVQAEVVFAVDGTARAIRILR